LLQLVLSAGFDSAQGLLFSGPVPAEEVERIVRSWPPDVEVSMPSQGALRGRPEQGVLE
jgi:hypothetical protein